jgi:hypothetical protein
MPTKLVKIGERAFEGCSSLASLILPSRCEVIGFDAFADCSSLRRIAIPRGMRELEELEVFGGCDALAEISYGGNLEGWEYLTRGKSLTVERSDLSHFSPKIYFMDLKI